MVWSLQALKDDFVILTLGLNKFVDEGYPSPYILSDKVFEKLLKDAPVQRKGLIFPQEIYNLSLYRKLSTVVFKSYKPKQALFYLAIPLIGDDSQAFDLYRVSSLPLHLPNTNRFLMYENEHKFLAVSNDRQKFMELDNIAGCTTHNSLMVCLPDRPIYMGSANHCAFDVFTNKGSNTCIKHVVKSFAPKFIRIPEGYVFAAETPLQLHITCGDRRFTIKTGYQGILRVAPNCDIYSDTLTIPGHTNMKSHMIDYDLEFQKVNVSQLIPAELMNISHTIDRLQSVLNLTLPNEPISLHSIENRLKLLDVNNRMFSWRSPFTISGFVGAFLLATTIMAIIAIYVKYRYNNTRILLPTLFQVPGRNGRTVTHVSPADAETLFTRLCEPNT